MAHAMLYPEPEKGGRGKKNPLLSKEFSAGLISQARTVLRETPESAGAVMSGDLTLAEAYEVALRVRSDRCCSRPLRASIGARW